MSQVPHWHCLLWRDILWRVEQPKTGSLHEHHIARPVGKTSAPYPTDMDIDIIRKTSIPRSATYGLKWREEVVKDGALGQSGEPAVSPVVWASRPGDVQVGEVGRCKVGERLVGRKIFWTKGKQTSTGKESVPGLAEHRSPCLGMWLASRCMFQTRYY